MRFGRIDLLVQKPRRHFNVKRQYVEIRINYRPVAVIATRVWTVQNTIPTRLNAYIGEHFEHEVKCCSADELIYKLFYNQAEVILA